MRIHIMHMGYTPASGKNYDLQLHYDDESGKDRFTRYIELSLDEVRQLRDEAQTALDEAERGEHS